MSSSDRVVLEKLTAGKDRIKSVRSWRNIKTHLFLEPPLYKCLARDVSEALRKASENDNFLSQNELSRRLNNFRDASCNWDTSDRVEIIIKHAQIRRSLYSLLEGDPFLSLTSDPEIDDLRDIAGFVSSAVGCQEEKEALLHLQGQDATIVLDLLQNLVDDLPPVFLLRHHFERVLKKLSLNSGCLPKHLFLSNVSCSDRDPCGGGGFADVFCGTYNGTPVALKRLRIFGPADEKAKVQNTILQEALIWRQLSHPYILRFLGVSTTVFRHQYCLVSPWMEFGTLVEYLRSTPHVTHVDRRKLLGQIADGMRYLHSLEPQVIHGDLRGANILVDKNNCPQITDFGLARIIDSHASTMGAATSHVKGSPRWMAPELLSESGSLSTSSDVYAFGCVCLEVLTGEVPFAKMRETVVPLAVRDGRKPDCHTDGVAECFDSAFRSLMMECWSYNPSERPSMSEVVTMLPLAFTSQTAEDLETGYVVDASDLDPSEEASTPRAMRMQPSPSNLDEGFGDDAIHLRSLLDGDPLETETPLRSHLYVMASNKYASRHFAPPIPKASIPFFSHEDLDSPTLDGFNDIGRTVKPSSTLDETLNYVKRARSLGSGAEADRAQLYDYEI